MNMNRTERNRIKTDRAWSKLYQRLEEDRLIPAKEDKKLRMSPLWKWGGSGSSFAGSIGLCRSALFFRSENSCFILFGGATK